MDYKQGHLMHRQLYVIWPQINQEGSLPQYLPQRLKFQHEETHLFVPNKVTLQTYHSANVYISGGMCIHSQCVFIPALSYLKYSFPHGLPHCSKSQLNCHFLSTYFLELLLCS